MTETANEQTFWEALRSGKFARMVKEEARGQQLNSPQEVFNIVKPLFAEKSDVERLYCIFLDTKNRMLAIEKMFSGSLNSSTVYPRELIKRVIRNRAAAVLIIHNHPSGCPDPSRDDQLLTRKVALALEAIEVKLHDHIIVGNTYFSMSEQGWIKDLAGQVKQFLSE